MARLHLVFRTGIVVHMVEVTVPVTLSDGAVVPVYQTPGAAGVDLCCVEAFTLAPLQRQTVRTGLRMAIPEGFEGQIRPRSGLAARHGISMVNSPGTIDSDYRGEIGVLLINLGTEAVEFKQGDRVAQMVFCPVTRVRLETVNELDSTARGEGGFGSTGV